MGLAASDARVALFAVPHAGAGAAVFRSWVTALPEWIALRAVRLPGGESRILEPPQRSLDVVATALADIVYADDLPICLFGHCSGAIIAYQVASQLAATGAPAPLLLIISEQPPPSVVAAAGQAHNLPREQFIEYVRGLEGTPRPSLKATNSCNSSNRLYAPTSPLSKQRALPQHPSRLRCLC